MKTLKLNDLEMNILTERLSGLSNSISVRTAYDGVAKTAFARCGDGTCANTNSADCCRGGGCNGWD